MQLNDFREEHGFSARDILDRLAWDGIRQKADEIARMPRFQHHADLAVGLESANSRPVPRARIDHDKRSHRRIKFATIRRNDPNETVIHRTI